MSSQHACGFARANFDDSIGRKAYGTARGRVLDVSQDAAGWTVSIEGEIFECTEHVAAMAHALRDQTVVARVTYERQGDQRTPLKLLKLRTALVGA